MINQSRLLDSSTIIEGMAEILWGSGWADHVEEHGCANLSGEEITSIMPEIPARVYALAERIMGHIEHANGLNEAALFWRALRADGLDPEVLSEAQTDNGIGAYKSLEERFGNCLAHMAMGSGVSWFDDHGEFDLKVPYCEAGECMMWAEEFCDE